ncbi:hypothetical protein [Anaerolactibacter massiliensis]|uniref:hypothetical protein n=1 Tax=Anaerolactibacter massiliensis TaxID=2044573 RepID=UPI000CF86DE9|nr:hypothetical protein [Anaerolactibacter massiliensis]
MGMILMIAGIALLIASVVLAIIFRIKPLAYSYQIRQKDSVELSAGTGAIRDDAGAEELVKQMGSTVGATVKLEASTQEDPQKTVSLEEYVKRNAGDEAAVPLDSLQEEDATMPLPDDGATVPLEENNRQDDESTVVLEENRTLIGHLADIVKKS